MNTHWPQCINQAISEKEVKKTVKYNQSKQTHTHEKFDEKCGMCSTYMQMSLNIQFASERKKQTKQNKKRIDRTDNNNDGDWNLCHVKLASE